MSDDEQERRKRAAAAEHARWVADTADETVTSLEAKVAKAREDLGRARDGLAEAQQQAKEARRDADARSGDLAEVEPGPVTQAKADTATLAGKQGGR